MKDRILNIIVIVVMIIASNYPMYKSLTSTVEEAIVVVESIKDEIVIWQDELNRVRNHLNIVRNDMVSSINGGIVQTKATLDKIKVLESDIKLLGDKIDSFKEKTMDKVKEVVKTEKINNKIDSLKINAKDDIKKMIDFKKMMKIKG
jgi:hypothetical protein